VALIPQRRRTQGGHAILELAIGSGIFLALFTGAYQFGYTFYVYENLVSAVRAGARYGAISVYDIAVATVDSAPSSTFTTKVRNVTVYGNPDGAVNGATAVVSGLLPQHVLVNVSYRNNMPLNVTVSVNGFALSSMFRNWTARRSPLQHFSTWDGMTRQRRNSSAHRRRTQRGSGLVESALVYTIFLMLLIGTIDVGHVMFVQQSIAERVRSAARYGTSRDATAAIDTQMKNIVLYNTATPAVGVTPSFGLTANNVTVQRLAGAGENPDQITVKVASVHYTILTPFVSGTRTARTLSITLPMEAP
jgi:Flp pilus assembly protein TadG